jgi:virulence factor
VSDALRRRGRSDDLRPDKGAQGQRESTQSTESRDELEQVRVCTIGAGQMANRVHYPSLASFDDVQIVAACDIDEPRLRETAARWGIGQTFADYREMVQSVQPDAVYAIGQPHLMYDIWVWCLSQGCNLYIEKPMGLSLHQARMLAYLAEEHGAVTQVSHQRRSSPLLQLAYRECTARGPVTHAVCEFYKCAPEAMLGPRDHMMDDGVHAIDTLRWMCGGEVAGVESRCRRIGVPDVNWIGATLYFENESMGYLLNSWVSGRRVFRVEMHAPGIAVDAEVEGTAWVYADGDYEGKRFDAREVAGSDELFVYGGFQAKHREFIDVLRGRAECTGSPFSDAVKTMEVAETVLAQALLQERRGTSTTNDGRG